MDSHRPFIYSVSNWNVQYLCRKLLWTVLATSRPRRPPCHACFTKKILQDGNQQNISRVGGKYSSLFQIVHIWVKLQGGWCFWSVQILSHNMWLSVIIGFFRLKVIKILGCQWNEEMENFKMNLYIELTKVQFSLIDLLRFFSTSF